VASFFCFHELQYVRKQVTRKQWTAIFSTVSFHCTCAKNIWPLWNSKHSSYSWWSTLRVDIWITPLASSGRLENSL